MSTNTTIAFSHTNLTNEKTKNLRKFLKDEFSNQIKLWLWPQIKWQTFKQTRDAFVLFDAFCGQTRNFGQSTRVTGLNMVSDLNMSIRIINKILDDELDTSKTILKARLTIG